MIFAKHQMTLRSNIHISNAYLQSTENIQLLGITISRKVNFNKHVNKVLNKVSRISAMVWKDSDILSQKIRKILYSSLALPQFTFVIL